MTSSYSTLPGPVWARDTFDWCAPEGLVRLQDILQDKVPYQLAERQLVCTARLLMGQNLACVWATGEGKTSVFYLYSLVRPATLSIVVSPTNALESDMMRRLGELGIPSLAVNQETLTAASPSRDLWAEVKSGSVNVVLLSPEMLLSKRFKEVIKLENIRACLALFCVDECHLVDEWGPDFRKAYASIADTIPWLPPWTTRLALTATLEPGRQTNVVTKALGFCDSNFYLDRRDCERYNIDVVIRPVEHAYTTDEFHDLDWVIRSDIKCAADVPKTLIYCETIDLGHRVAGYLRSRLPSRLRTQRNIIIRHAHSLNCPQCKTEILSALYQSGSERVTAIVVATDVLGVGMDVPDCDQVICFPTPSSMSSMVQRIGRTSRARDRRGTAYVYIKKADIEAVTAYLRTSKIDSRFLSPALSTSAGQGQPGGTSDDNTTSEPNKVSKKIATRINSDVFIKNLSLWAVVSAYVQDVCIVRQMNIIQGNPGIDRDCGRCSSCSPHPIPLLPSPLLPSSSAMASTPIPDEPSVASDVCASDNLPAHLKLKAADIERLKEQLDEVAFKVRDEGPDCADDVFVGYQAFLDPRWVSKIVDKFLLVTSKEVLAARLDGWEYWEAYGDALWHEVGKLADEMREELEQRHEVSKQNRREKAQEIAKVRKANAAAGLSSVKKVTLRVRAPTVSPLTASAVGKENTSSSSIPETESTANLASVPSSERPPTSPKRTQPFGEDILNTPRKKKRQRIL